MLIGTSRRLLALAFIVFLSLNFDVLSQTISQPPQPLTGKAVDHFVFSSTVTNEKGVFITRLQKEHFRIFFDKEPANIVSVSDADVPLSVGLVFDVSASLNVPGGEKAGWAVINSMQQALKSFLGLSNKSNEYFLLAFNQKPQLLVDWTSDSNSLINSLNVVQPKGNTALYDACYLALYKLQQGRHSKRLLILISDGVDNTSKYSFGRVREALKESDVLLYSIYLSGPQIPGPLGDDAARTLDELASISGGMFIFGKNGKRLKASDAAWALETIADELDHQYSIGVQPPASKVDGKWHKIRIKLETPANAPGEAKHLFIRSREGFYLNRQ